MKGSCLCGAVSIVVKGLFEHLPEACHCQQCRKQTGGYLMGVNVRKRALSGNGDESVVWYQSSDEVKRGFCRNCGLTLFWMPELVGYE